MAGSLFAQDLARIHYAVRVEGALHGAHERKLDRGGVALELAHLESPDAMLGTEAAAELVYQLVHEFGGSFSAEHGIGRLKVGELERYASPVELALMRAVKRAFDPHGIMNPGKVLREQ